MKKRFISIALTPLVLLLSARTVMSADLIMPMQVGQKYIFSQYREADPINPWTVTSQVIGQTTVCSEEYFHLKSTNYYNEGEIDDHYFRSTDTSFYYCNSNTECAFNLDAAVGSQWICGDNLFEIHGRENVTIPYGGNSTLEATVVKKHHIPGEPLNYWYGYLYFVPGMGLVKERDSWNETNEWVTQELVDIQFSSVPALSQGGFVILSLVLILLVGFIKIEPTKVSPGNCWKNLVPNKKNG